APLIVYYLDASARYYQERGSAWIRNMFAHHRLVASASLGVIEVTATLARKVKGCEIDPSMLDNKLQELDEDWTRFIQVHMTMDVVDMARQVAQGLWPFAALMPYIWHRRCFYANIWKKTKAPTSHLWHRTAN
ncbi:MAG TPA: type II toxin-antitoxin system VapC family toxin, partial [Candidatus Entotheonella sp.]